MNRITVAVDQRDETGKGPARRLRAAGQIPAIFYGRKSDPIKLAVNEHEFKKLLEQAGSNPLFDLQIGGTINRSALLKERQVRPTDGKMLHLDFQEILMDELVEVTVPLEFEGKAIGVEKGGDFLIVTRELRVSCLTGNIPEKIVVDVSSLELGHSIHVGEITLPEGVTPDMEAGVALASVTTPKKEGEEAAAEEPEKAE
ncbi:MAG: 50S ribosomal protein L25 [Desulfomonile tiedjei]|uniref:Large ribosomal subunit protein bL25 n=1 Tax=Desulfomonile tiedjei TaxID=2358 RepID=A0A9D6V526_9BACT|nr:50S ribosomal protein L25 [Desulfomonile tiedjei]